MAPAMQYPHPAFTVSDNATVAYGPEHAPWSTDAKHASLGAPENFGQVIDGVYRSSYPQEENLEFMKTLGLKTIITLVDSECPPKFQAFMHQEGINHVIIDMKGTKKVAISMEIIKQVLTVLLDRSQYPVMIHCNHGKHRTGCSVAIMRKLMGWSVKDCVAEYTAYAGEKVREQDIDYITKFRTPDLAALSVNRYPSFPALSMTVQGSTPSWSFLGNGRKSSRWLSRIAMASVMIGLGFLTYSSISDISTRQWSA